ncbi:MAG: SoxR reducing system RseC family protein [bacterium]
MRRITETGEVIKAEGMGKMVIQFNSDHTDCSSCPLQGKCGSGRNIPQLEIENLHGLKPGDKVKVTMPYFPQSLFNLLLFGIPVLMLVILFLIFTQLSLNENLSFFLALGGTVVCFILVLAGMKKIEKMWAGKIEIRKLDELSEHHG